MTLGFAKSKKLQLHRIDSTNRGGSNWSVLPVVLLSMVASSIRWHVCREGFASFPSLAWHDFSFWRNFDVQNIHTGTSRILYIHTHYIKTTNKQKDSDTTNTNNVDYISQAIDASYYWTPAIIGSTHYCGESSTSLYRPKWEWFDAGTCARTVSIKLQIRAGSFNSAYSTYCELLTVEIYRLSL